MGNQASMKDVTVTVIFLFQKSSLPLLSENMAYTLMLTQILGSLIQSRAMSEVMLVLWAGVLAKKQTKKTDKFPSKKVSVKLMLIIAFQLIS